MLKMKYFQKKIFLWINLIGLSLVSFLFFGEIIFRLANSDMLLFGPLLYYQCGDVEIHRVSSNTNLLFEMKPGAKVKYGDYGDRTVTINQFGFRDKPRKKEKTPGVFRIICLGGSNTYGGGVVNNDEVYPAYLEKILNEKFSNKFEVWNVGVSAYVLSQKVELAKFIIKEFDPDLLIFQHGNQGRRAFLEGKDFTYFFRRNPELYWENLKFIPFWDKEIGKKLLLHSALYRTAVIFLNHLYSVPGNNPLYSNGEIINENKFIEFCNQYNPKIPIILMPFENTIRIQKETGIDVIRLFDKKNLPPDVDREYFETHPPAYVYKWYAEVIMNELIRMGYLRNTKSLK